VCMQKSLIMSLMYCIGSVFHFHWNFKLIFLCAVGFVCVCVCVCVYACVYLYVCMCIIQPSLGIQQANDGSSTSNRTSTPKPPQTNPKMGAGMLSNQYRPSRTANIASSFSLKTMRNRRIHGEWWWAWCLRALKLVLVSITVSLLIKAVGHILQTQVCTHIYTHTHTYTHIYMNVNVCLHRIHAHTCTCLLVHYNLKSYT